MSLPTVTPTLSGYSVSWEEEKIKVVVSRLHAHRDDRVTGEILITTTAESYTNPLKAPFNVNFLSDRTLVSHSKELKTLYPAWDWATIIGQLAVKVLESVRAGEPVKEYSTSDDIKPPEWLLEPLLLKGLPTIIFGEKGVAKSNLALVLYLVLTLPWNDNPLGFTAPKHSIKTVYLDWELPGEIAQWNLKRLAEGMGIGPAFLYHRRCIAPLADDIESIQKYLDNLKAEAIIIDSLGRACGGELSKDTENTNRFFEAVDKLKVSPLILAQTSKDQDSKHKTIYGNVFFTYYARSIFELRKAESIGEDEISVALFHRWSNLTKLYKPSGFHFNFNGQHTTIESEPVTYTEFLEKANRQLQILDLLRSGAFTTETIMEKLDIKRGNADMALKRLKDKHKIIKLDDGRWALPASI